MTGQGIRSEVGNFFALPITQNGNARGGIRTQEIRSPVPPVCLDEHRRRLLDPHKPNPLKLHHFFGI
jgi:hypothetical protein